jgi:putative SOS response-associated peptidase YedK
MCNRYRPANITRVRDAFGFTHIEDGPEYSPRGIGPWHQGPFVRAAGLAVGQWGLIPFFSKTRRPTGKGGRPISTNNARIETVATAPTFKSAWSRGQRCLVPAEDFDEPCWGTGKNVWWRFARADGQPWALAGLWSEWTEPETGELVLSFTMLTQNCDAHPVFSRMHKPDLALAPDKQDKRSIVPIERHDWEQWLLGTIDEARELVRLPACELRHGPADSGTHIQLPLA